MRLVRFPAAIAIGAVLCLHPALLLAETGETAEDGGTIENGPSDVEVAREAFRKKLLKLDDGMTKKQVMALFGEPSRTSLETCGTATKRPWPCLNWTYTYGDSSRALLEVTFRNDSGVWHVNSWQVDNKFK